MRGRQLAAGKAIGLVQDQDDTADGRRRDECPEEFPSLLFGRCAAQPIADLEVGNESASHRERRTDYAADDQGRDHARRAVEADSDQDDRGQDQRHQGHTRDGVSSDDRDGIGCHSREQERDHANQKKADDGMEPIVEHAKLEEEEGDDEGRRDADHDDLHRQVSLGADSGRRIGTFLALELFGGQTNGTTDDVPRFDDADDTGRGDATNTDMAGVSRKDLLGTHATNGRSDGGVAQRKHFRSEQKRQARDDDQPDQE